MSSRKAKHPGRTHISIMEKEKFSDFRQIKPGTVRVLMQHSATVDNTKAMLGTITRTEAHPCRTHVDSESREDEKTLLADQGFRRGHATIHLPENFCTIDEIAKEVGWI